MAPRILILGGGFGGLTTARKLEQLLKPAEAEITLVSRENFSLFTPMLPEVGSGNLETRHVVTPLRAQLRRTSFVLADVRHIDLAAKTVDVEHTLRSTTTTLGYEHLIFALGGVTSTFGLPGIAERSFPYKTLEDADRLRNHIIGMLELADVTTDPIERKRLLTFVFVGGGFTGVEAAGEMADFFHSTVRFYPSIGTKDIEVALVEGGKKLLPDLQAGMGEYSAKALSRRGVRVMLETLVAGADEHGLRLKDGTSIETRTIVWSAGVKPSPVVADLPIATGRGGSIVTNADMSVPNYSGLWAIGDCASIPTPRGGTVPATAQHAIREGPVLAGNIAATLRGERTTPFDFQTVGMMASLGARRGVAGLFGKYLVTGFLAWLIWRSYYLARLPGLDRRLRVAFDWALGLVFPRDIAELRVYSSAAQERARHDAGLAAVAQDDALASSAT
ncbi:MAG: NAD(P)/FAD-dependent oxidoreductase [Candidatus Eremiobacteraeota bacterium]|nr:NAD(P)/FAD-dependent oxidoreductase [Candidatus Eremiobacteraeota bacterium]